MGSHGKEYASLLFTPRPSEKPSEGNQGRSPRSTRSPSTPAYGRTYAYREGSASRRRSLTPTGSVKDTPPPPPPSFSLLDAQPGGARSGQAADTAQLGNGALALQPVDGASSRPEVLEDTWVTVFGFQSDDEHTIMSEFAKCGEIQQFGSGREDRVNWIHIKYASPFQAQRALMKNGQVVGGRLMIGVQALQPRHRSAAESLEGSTFASASQKAAKPILVRPYRVDANGAQGLLPQASKSTWTKLNEFVFGL